MLRRRDDRERKFILSRLVGDKEGHEAWMTNDQARAFFEDVYDGSAEEKLEFVTRRKDKAKIVDELYKKYQGRLVRGNEVFKDQEWARRKKRASEENYEWYVIDDEGMFAV